MEPKEKRAFEPTGLVPRSIVRTFERFRQQLLPGSEKAAMREYRISRYQVLVSARCLFVLLTIPIATNWFISGWLLSPVIEHVWNTQQNQVFLNSYQEERAFAELEFFSDKLFFESLLTTEENHDLDSFSGTENSENQSKSVESKEFIDLSVVHGSSVVEPQEPQKQKSDSSMEIFFDHSSSMDNKIDEPNHGTQGKKLKKEEKLSYPVSNFISSSSKADDLLNSDKRKTSMRIKPVGTVKIKEKIQEKILELAVYYNQQTILSITNIAGDCISLLTLACLFLWMKPEISILKSFLIEAIYSLSDTTKSFFLILLTDLLVGFHSPRGWETALELLLKHLGLPENQDFVFLFVATFPVLLDTVFKYWIFRHLNKISPSTVATYHSMIE